MTNPTQLLNELRERYCDLDSEERREARQAIFAIRFMLEVDFSSPEEQLAYCVAELNESTKQTMRDLQSLRKGA